MRSLLFLASAVFAFAQIEPPVIGLMLDSNSDARPVRGVASSATLDDPVWSGVVSLACAASTGCWAKTASALVSTAGDVTDAPPGGAIFAINETDAYVYFPESRQLRRLSRGDSEGRWNPVDFSPEGDVLALRATAAGLEYATRRGDSVWIGDRNFGEASAIYLLDDGGVLLAGAQEVTMLRTDGPEAHLPVAGVVGFTRMGDGAVQFITLNGMWVFSTELGSERVFLLPGVAP